MARPCLLDHPPSPKRCRICRWCSDPSALGEAHRRVWGESRRADWEPRELVPGVPDPIPDGVFDAPPIGWTRDPAVTERHREALRFLAGTKLSPPPRTGEGVVLVGGGRYWPGIVVSVRMLRESGCSLPVQIWHRGSDEPVRPSDLSGLGAVEVRDLTALRPAPRTTGGWPSKTTALLGCGWERVLYFDADAYCVADPTPLLNRLSPESPFLFWEDFPGARLAVDWGVWGRTDSAVPPVQGGQYAVHLGHFWREFVLAYWLDQHSDYSYTHQYGDQDSWRVALTFTGGRYASLGPAQWRDVAFVCSDADRPLVVHRCQSKMLYPEDHAPGDRASNRRSDRLPQEDRAWAHWQAVLDAREAADVFGRVYASGLWGPGQTSGSGSTPEAARPYLDIVNGLTRLSGWERVVDLGSGDGYVNSRLAAREVVAVECHEPHVRALRALCPTRECVRLDLNRDRDRLPSGDVALLKDVLHHWPNSLVRDWLQWARGCGKWRWLICTQDNLQSADGEDCPLGGYRALNPDLAPLRDLGFVRFADYLGKSVLLLPIDR